MRKLTILLLALVCASAVRSRAAEAQAANSTTANSAPAHDPIDVMREELKQGKYSDVLRRGNDLLGSSRAFSVGEQVLLWQVMAAAYYPPDVNAQQPDSARLPLDALVRLAPDADLPPDLRWAGLDSLLERARSGTFAVVARPVAEYSITMAEPAFLTVVATRPARFRLISVSAATGVAVVHDSADATRTASLRLRVHDGLRPLMSGGDHILQVVAVDVSTGDSVVVSRRARARSNNAGLASPVPPFIPPSTVSMSPTSRGAMLLGGLAFAGATVAIAQGARAQEPIRSGFKADERAMIVGGAMVGAALTALFIDRGRRRPATEAEVMRARAAYDRRVATALNESRARAERYRVTLTVEQEDR